MPDYNVVTLNATIRPDQMHRIESYRQATGKINKSEAVRELFDIAFSAIDRNHSRQRPDFAPTEEQTA